jgi:hypothetical protein
MRLLNSHTYQLKFYPVDLEDGSKPSYAILSHTWGDEEITMQELKGDGQDERKGFAKIRGCCEQAKKDGLDWVWIDTCCIDSTNSTELSEAINSMYAWYRHSTVCYALLEDVPPRDPHISQEKFEKARWFTRGWCLQELIAPSKVEFYAQDWTILGTKWSLQNIITRITAIPPEALLNRNLENYSVAQKMSWAANRKTTRVEDEAYCLLGIFDIHMPLLYGEGKKSFLRLQTEILQRTEDYSFLIWTAALHQRWRAGLEKGVLPVVAFSPSLFPRKGAWSVEGMACRYEDLKPFYDFRNDYPGTESGPAMVRHPPQLTSRGLRAWMFVREADASLLGVEGKFMILWTEYMYEGRHVCIAITASRKQGYVTYDRAMGSQVILVDDAMLATFSIKDLYLTTSHQTHLTPKRWVVPYLEGLEIIIVSRPSLSNANITFITSFPKDARLIQQGLVDDIGGQHIYSENIRSAMAQFKTGPGNWPLSLEFEVNTSTSPTSAATEHCSELLVVNLWLEAENPRCYAWVRKDTEKTAAVRNLNTDWFATQTYEQATDVMDVGVLDGNATVFIVIKCREGAQLQGNEVKPSFFSVSITLFSHQKPAGGLHEEDRQCFGAGTPESIASSTVTFSDRVRRKVKPSQSREYKGSLT